MNVLGEIRVVARSGLGDLGATEGPPTLYTWTPASLIPQLLPWVGVLLLLLLPANRCAGAWWVWAPLVALALLEAGARFVFTWIPSEALDMFCLAFGSLGFGVAGVWLAAPYLGQRSRWVAFFGMLLVLGVVGGLACAARSAGEVGFPEALGVLAFLGAGGLILASSLSLAALPCRRRGGAGRLLMWLAVFLVVSWVTLCLPFVGFAWMMGDGPGWSDLALAVLGFAGVTFAVALPFLLLAFLLAFYRQRIWTLLRLQRTEGTPPPPEPPVIAEAAQP